MQTCPECGLTDIDEVIENHTCGEGVQGVASVANLSGRPDGDGLMSSGAWLMAIGVAVAVIAGIVSSNAGDGAHSEYAIMEAAREALFYANVAWFGSGLFSIGLLVWLTGNIVKAISFLPAKVGE